MKKRVQLVGASLGGGDSSGLESGREELDVGGLMGRDLGDTVADPGFITSSCEVFSRELLKGALVEGGLEVLEGQSVVEDISVCKIECE